ncbi:MAG: peptide ABC transporter permease, partial [Chloroflexi bacterium]|nr:peptide ABC transporter permease [Chloroflexota bacterium]
MIDARLASGFPGTANADDRAKLEAHFGLDKPVHVQYVTWIGQVFSGDFGTSWLTKEDILDNFGRRMPVTIELLIL